MLLRDHFSLFDYAGQDNHIPGSKSWHSSFDLPGNQGPGAMTVASLMARALGVPRT
jgi:hypothetical protein